MRNVESPWERSPLSRTLAAAGMTLTELVVVLAILGIVAGIGMALLSGSGAQIGMKASLREIVSLLSYARATSSRVSAVCWIAIDPETGRLKFGRKQPMATWHFETLDLPQSATASRADAVPSLTQQTPGITGILGRGLVFTKGATLVLDDVDPFSPDQGTLVEFWLLPRGAHDEEQIVLDKAGEYRVWLNEKLQLCSRFAGGPPRVHPVALVAQRWNRILAARYWGKDVLEVNRYREAWEAEGEKLPDLDSPVVLGSRSEPFWGILDELEVSALVVEQELELPPGVRIVRAPREIVFGSGRLDAEVHAQAVELELELGSQSASVRVSSLGAILVREADSGTEEGHAPAQPGS